MRNLSRYEWHVINQVSIRVHSGIGLEVGGLVFSMGENVSIRVHSGIGLEVHQALFYDYHRWVSIRVHSGIGLEVTSSGLFAILGQEFQSAFTAA